MHRVQDQGRGHGEGARSVALIDLHVHTTASDGSVAPVDILNLARRDGLKAIAITDHDTVAGVNAALGAGIPPGLGFVTGIEISAARPAAIAGKGSFHVLGYGLEPAHRELNHHLVTLQHARRQRNPEILLRLGALGMPLTMEEVLAVAGGKGQIGRPHIAAAMVAKGQVGTIDEAFDRFLGTGKPAYVDKYRLACDQAIGLIRAAGGLAFLAHPGLLNLGSPQAYEALVADLVAMGLEGLEVFYPEHDPAQTAFFATLAGRFGLLASGGTDFHGTAKPQIRLGCGRGDFTVPDDVFTALRARLGPSLSS